MTFLVCDVTKIVLWRFENRPTEHSTALRKTSISAIKCQDMHFRVFWIYGEDIQDHVDTANRPVDLISAMPNIALKQYNVDFQKFQNSARMLKTYL